MTQDFDLLDDLPKFQASGDFENRLMADAMAAQMPSGAEARAVVVPLKKRAPIWAGFAMAASLALGIFFGFGEYNMLSDAMTGLGFDVASTDEVLVVDSYTDALSALSL